jgi:hypothetical protein
MPKKTKVAFIQLARYGDIVNILPIVHEMAKEYDVDIYVHEDFADMIEGLNYCTAVPQKTTHRAVAEAAMIARDTGKYEQVYVTQYDGNPEPPNPMTESYQTSSWARIGWLDKFHQLPLILPETPKKIKPQEGLLGICLDSHSSRFINKPGFAEWVTRQFGEKWKIFDFAALKVKKVRDLVPIIAGCQLLLTVDTLHAHLAYATGTPTIVLSRPRPWDQSEPRAHWVEHFVYTDTETPLGLQWIDQAVDYQRSARLQRIPRDMLQPSLHLVIQEYTPEHEEEKLRVANAKSTWEEALKNQKHTQMYRPSVKDMPRNSNSIGDPRGLMFINDILDYAADKASGYHDIICYTNTDICLTQDALEVVFAKLKTLEACFSARVDCTLPEAQQRFLSPHLAQYPAYVGTDLVAFRKRWWTKWREIMPPLILGYEAWDWVMRMIIRQVEGDGAEIRPPVCYHARHTPFWADGRNIQTHPGQLYCRRIARQWALDNGLQDGLNPEGFRTVFRPDKEWNMPRVHLKAIDTDTPQLRTA